MFGSENRSLAAHIRICYLETEREGERSFRWSAFAAWENFRRTYWNGDWIWTFLDYRPAYSRPSSNRISAQMSGSESQLKWRKHTRIVSSLRCAFPIQIFRRRGDGEWRDGRWKQMWLPSRMLNANGKNGGLSMRCELISFPLWMKNWVSRFIQMTSAISIIKR